MKKLILLLFFVFVSCRQEVVEADILKLNGYWEIDYVELADGSKKEYKVNEMVDFIDLKQGKGFRKKVYPQLDGRYLSSDFSERVTVVAGEEYFLECSTKFSKWREEIVALKDSVLVLKNDQKVVYHYKRLIPFSLK